MTDPSESDEARKPESQPKTKSLKDRAAQQIQEVQTQYEETNKQLTGILTQHIPHEYYDDIYQNVASDYEDILQENMVKLKQIAKEDFDICNRNNQKLVEDTKEQIHCFIYKTFQEHASKKDFTQIAETIFENVNKKVREDLKSKTKSTTKAVESTRNSISPDININFDFRKMPEEVEAEQGLQKFFEEEILQFSEQIEEDFGNIREKMLEDVDETKNKLKEIMAKAREKAVPRELPEVRSLIPEAPENHTLLNLPSGSAVEQNINDLSSHTQNEFNKVNENMQKEVEETKEQINEKTKFYLEKGKNLLNFRDDPE
ncbi:unnamed protein product [Ceutorhynchus assimilis]|uniref:Uncharacterized protein n=1 Tax=Ceutorhynchus assimilis TaxID=467358 RepID=A0A9N9MXX8_9CUCU|nr:unnamed protein product [Ceutorhynchus assimilis]